jgi:Mg/Co/Ni transporter MgtE
MSETLNINDIISLVKESNKQFESDIYVPSLNKEIHCKPMNASHLKNIIKTSISGVFSNIKFNQTMYTVLKDVLDPSVSTTVINTFDKILILLQLRNKNVKNTVDVELFCDEDKRTESFSLDKIINKGKKDKFDFQEQTITDGSYIVTLDFPSIEQEFLFDRYFEQNKLKNVKEDDKNSLKELFGPLFIHEVAQYVKNIKISDKEINMRSLSVEDRTNIMENLSSNIIAQIIEKIDDVFGKQINKLISVEKDFDGTKYRGTIQINSTLFS